MLLKPFVLRFIYSFLMRGLLRWIIGVKWEKASFLLKENQFIIIANHNSHLDTMTLLASIPSRILPKVKPVAAADYFGDTPLKAKMSSYFVNALLISRSEGLNAIRQMKKALDDGYSLILYPEGSRGNPEEEQELKPGVALLLSLCPQVKYVPAHLTGMGRALPKGDNLLIPYESSLVYGKPRWAESKDREEILQQIKDDFKVLKTMSSATQDSTS